jgi:RimJ/RimL family protein N-acetyltransferase
MSPIPRDHASVHTLYLDTPTPADLLRVIEWRKTCPEALRTPREITPPEQERFYAEYIANPKSPHRYYAVRQHETHQGKFYADASPPPIEHYHWFVALVSLEHLSWENGHAELGLIVDPAMHGQGIGRQAVALALDVAFNRLALRTIWLEAYLCGHPQFWHRIIATYHGTSVLWPRRKFWAGALHDALLGTITVAGYRQAQQEEARDE